MTAPIRLERAAKPRACKECRHDTDPDELMLDDEGREVCVTCYCDCAVNPARGGRGTVKQPHPEINFRIGRGRRREQRKALSPSAFLDAMRAVGMSDDEIRAELKKLRGKKEQS